jgi:hypothetical protein
MKSVFAAALGAAFLLPFSALALLEDGQTMPIPFVCKTLESISSIKKEDEKSPRRAMAMIRKLINDGICGPFNPPLLLPVGRLLEAYTDSKGIISEIRVITSPETGKEWFTITADPRQKTSI